MITTKENVMTIDEIKELGQATWILEQRLRTESNKTLGHEDMNSFNVMIQCIPSDSEGMKESMTDFYVRHLIDVSDGIVESIDSQLNYHAGELKESMRGMLNELKVNCQNIKDEITALKSELDGSYYSGRKI